MLQIYITIGVPVCNIHITKDCMEHNKYILMCLKSFKAVFCNISLESHSIKAHTGHK